jgi:3-hydroxyisobutyrate dehydrogenase
MGGGMGAALIDAGFDVAVFDVSETARATAEADGASTVSSARELGERCDLVVASLPGPAYVEGAVLDETGGLLAGMEPETTLIDTTTTSLDMVRRVSEACKSRGVAHLDAPVSGRPPNMSMLIGGPAELAERHRSVLDAISTQQFFLGEVGAGTIAKLMNQYVSYANFLLICEAATLAERAGIAPAALVGALSESSASSGMLDLFRHYSVDNDLAFTPGPVALIAKDMALVLDCLRTMNVVESPAATWVHDVFRRGADDLAVGGEPFPEIARVIERDLEG